MSGVQTVKRSGSRFYVDPERPLITVPGVTSIINMLPKTFLQFWSAKMAAELAVDSIDILPAMVERDRDGAVNYLKGAATNYTKSRADVGSRCHDMFERMIRGENIGRVHPDLEPYRRNFEQFLAMVNPELVSAEDIMWSDQHEYAGSSDAIFRIWLDENNRVDPTRRRGVPVLVLDDWKTSKDLHAEVALQLSAYANADRIVKPDGSSQPMPEIEMGAALHITENTWEFRPIDIGPDVFEVFLALRRVFEWDREGQRDVIGKALASGGAEGLVTGTQRRGK